MYYGCVMQQRCHRYMDFLVLFVHEPLIVMFLVVLVVFVVITVSHLILPQFDFRHQCRLYFCMFVFFLQVLHLSKMEVLIIIRPVCIIASIFLCQIRSSRQTERFIQSHSHYFSAHHKHSRPVRKGYPKMSLHPNCILIQNSQHFSVLEAHRAHANHSGSLSHWCCESVI